MHRAFAVLAAAYLAVPSTLYGDTVYFVSKSYGSLHSFDTSGTTITTLSGTGTFTSPAALAIGPDGNLYVGDEVGGGRIARYVLSTGSVSSVMSLSGTAPAFAGGPVSPASIAFTPGGKMLVGRNPQKAFGGYPGGPVLEINGWNGGSPSAQAYTSGTSLDYQTGLAVAADGTLYASNTVYDIFANPPALVGNVVRFNNSGVYEAIVAATGSLQGPAGLAVSGSSLFIASTMDGVIYRTDLTNPNTASNTSTFASTGGDYIGPLAMLADGGLLVGSVSGPAGLIYRFTSTGQALSPYGNASYGQIGGIAVAPVPEPAAVATVACGAVTVLATLLRRRTSRNP
jgi:sugar lactone lactonase YvrE